jgi:TonB family protein
MRVLSLTILTLVLGLPTPAEGPSDAVRALFSKTEGHSSLTAPGSPPFHLKLKVSAAGKEHPEFDTVIEIWWAAPDKWRREIKSSTFSQTAIQNGQHYAESNSTDYFPWWLYNVIGETLDPLPLAELQSLNLDLQAGDRCLKWDNTFAQGTDQIGISNAVCFNSDGTLKNVFSRTADAQFGEYRNFGPKKVARALESGTHTADYKNVDLRTAITFIEPLQETPELFVVSTDTGLNARLRFVNVSESALRDFKLTTPPPQWPVIHNLPNSGIMTVNLKIDRAGVVREVGSPISRNVVLADPAREQLKNWKFKPFLADGAPVQVNVDVAFKFDAKMEPYGANGEDFPVATFYQRIAKSRELSDPRSEGGKHFQLDAVFQYGQDPPGKYSEIWHSPVQWRRQATLGNLSITESQDGDRLYRKFTGSDFSPKKLDDVLDQMSGLFPRTDGSFIEGDWGVSAVQWGGAAMLRVARGKVDAQNNPTSGQAYWFDASGLLRGAYVQPATSTYSDFSKWSGKEIPRKTEVSENGTVILRIAIEQITSPVEDFGFVLEVVKPTSVHDAEDYNGPSIVQALPIFRPKPVDPHFGRGTVLVDVMIDRHGHVRAAQIKQSAGKILDDAALQAAMLWEFTPMMIKGRTVPGSSTLRFKFSGP